MTASELIVSALGVLWREDDGQDLVEYALLLAFISIVAILSLKKINTALSTLWSSTASVLTSTAAS
jgi:Flp pilus assembly pilin Flp